MSRRRKNPDRGEVEKIAKEIVIRIQQEPEADPYDMIRETGFSDNILEEILRKTNVFRFLSDFEGHSGDPHNRDVGCPPLDIQKLLGDNVSNIPEAIGGSVLRGGKPDSIPEGTSVKKIEGPGMSGVVIKKKTTVPLVSMERDFNDMEKVKLDEEPEGPKPKEDKVASANARKEEARQRRLEEESSMEMFSAEKMAAARTALSEEIYVIGHALRGSILKMAEFAAEDDDIAREIKRCYPENKVAQMILEQAGKSDFDVEIPRYAVIQYPKIATAIDNISSIFSELGKKQELLDLLDAEISLR